MSLSKHLCSFKIGVLFRFLDENCAAFEGATLDGEQRHEWTQVHKDFLSLMEGMMETWLAAQGISVEALYEKLSVVNEHYTDEEWLPSP
jgi:The ARF-like 2 binding protein BART.